jgi:GNAT superfamily N-acetyltransferase
VLVRRAGRRDLDDIHERWLLLRERDAKIDARLSVAKGASDLAREHRQAILADPRTAFFVAEERGEIVGFLHAQIEANDPTYEVDRFGRLVDLYVDPARRRESVGQMLLEVCKEWFTSHGLREFRVVTPSAFPDAQGFFEHVGLTPLTTTSTAPLE